MATLMCGLITSGRLARAVEPAIAGVTASGAAADGHAAAAAVDGDPATYWQSPADSSMQDYRRFLDFDLHGAYSISQIDITNLAGSYYHYEVYLSKDGADYGKVAYKSDAAAANAVHKAQSPVMRVGDEAPLTAAKAGSAAPAANIALAATLDIANGVDVILTGEVDGHMIDSMADAKPVLKTSTPDATNTPEPSEVPVKSETYAAVTSVATVLGETRLPGTSPMMTRARRESYIGG